MADQPDLHPAANEQADVAKFVALVAALGLPSGNANALERALDVKTVRELAQNKYVRRAQAILNLAKAKD